MAETPAGRHAPLQERAAFCIQTILKENAREEKVLVKCASERQEEHENAGTAASWQTHTHAMSTILLRWKHNGHEPVGERWEHDAPATWSCSCAGCTSET